MEIPGSLDMEVQQCTISQALFYGDIPWNLGLTWALYMVGTSNSGSWNGHWLMVSCDYSWQIMVNWWWVMANYGKLDGKLMIQYGFRILKYVWWIMAMANVSKISGSLWSLIAASKTWRELMVHSGSATQLEKGTYLNFKGIHINQYILYTHMCIYVYMYTYIYAYIYIYIYMFIDIHIHMCICIHVYIYIHIFIHIQVGKQFLTGYISN